jgi:hypothetical protein
MDPEIGFIGGFVSLAVMIAIFLVLLFIYNNFGIRELLARIWKRVLKLPFAIRQVIYYTGIVVWIGSIIFIIYYASTP